jgi:8-oxo-dGTP pyrophosphatase MutT (NUDIX family)
MAAIDGRQAETAMPRRRAVRPRDAATLILVDRAAGSSVLMGRRSAGHGFMPGKWVFPGGAISRPDFAAPLAFPLRPDVLAALADPVGERRGGALAATAIRETFEETGLRLAAPAAHSRKRGAWHDFCVAGVAPDFGCLDYIGRMITPPHRAKRFDTRFFLADAGSLLDRHPADSRELEELAWFDIADAQTLDLAPPTIIMLRHIAKHDRQNIPFIFNRFVTPSAKASAAIETAGGGPQ